MPNLKPGRAAIGVRLDSLSELFERFDPAPMPQADLAPEVADYIISRASEASSEQDFDLSFHLGAADAERGRLMDLAQRVQTCFRVRAEQQRRHLSEVFRSGRQALAIGLAVLAVCLSLAWFIGAGAEVTSFVRLAQESLVVIGWVVIWRPAEIFLFDWIPIEQQKKLLYRLAGSTVAVVDDEHAPPSAPA